MLAGDFVPLGDGVGAAEAGLGDLLRVERLHQRVVELVPLAGLARHLGQALADERVVVAVVRRARVHENAGQLVLVVRLVPLREVLHCRHDTRTHAHAHATDM
jgi:hypothetical protein